MRVSLKPFRDALNLDTGDLNYNYWSPALSILDRPVHGKPQDGILRRVGAFGWRMWKAIKRGKIGSAATCVQDRVVFFACTKNQRAALDPVASHFRDRCFLGLWGFGEVEFPLFAAHVAALPFLPLVLRRGMTTKGYSRRAFRSTLDYVWLTYGYYVVARQILRLGRPRCVVVANDHALWTRALIKAASDEGVKTIYLQHAAVTEGFPPLTMDYALLDGEESLAKYHTAGHVDAAVFLLGIPRLDRHLRDLGNRSSVERLAICTNMLDPIQIVREVCTAIRVALPQLSMVLRPHPADKRFAIWQSLAAEVGIDFSDSRTDDVWGFLSGLDILVAGHSTILLEAALINVYPIQFDFEGAKRDDYGFVRKRLVECICESGEDVCGILKGLGNRRRDVRDRTRPFCASVGTRYHGRSTELAVEVIESVATGKDPSRAAHWEPRPRGAWSPARR